MITAVIFDMDGVLSDTQQLHAELESAVLVDYGLALSPEEITKKYAGVSSSIMFAEIFSKAGVSADPVEAAQKKWFALGKEIKKGFGPVAGAPELLQRLKESGLLLGVASASPLDFVELVLGTLDMRKYFQAVTSTREVAYGKPAPDVFLLAAKRLGVAPEECVVIEDAISGMLGARSAGMKCIGLVEDVTHEEYPADWLVRSLHEVTTDRIKSLLV